MKRTPSGRIRHFRFALQPLPPRTQEGKDIRRAFASAVPDPVLRIDYTALELRILADLLQKR